MLVKTAISLLEDLNRIYLTTNSELTKVRAEALLNTDLTSENIQHIKHFVNDYWRNR